MHELNDHVLLLEGLYSRLSRAIKLPRSYRVSIIDVICQALWRDAIV